MSCGYCVRAVTDAIHALDATAEVTVDLKNGSVATDSAVPRERIAAAIAAEGYEVS